MSVGILIEMFRHGFGRKSGNNEVVGPVANTGVLKEPSVLESVAEEDHVGATPEMAEQTTASTSSPNGDKAKTRVARTTTLDTYESEEIANEILSEVFDVISGQTSMAAAKKLQSLGWKRK